MSQAKTYNEQRGLYVKYMLDINDKSDWQEKNNI
jgi:hypothetical protein